MSLSAFNINRAYPILLGGMLLWVLGANLTFAAATNTIRTNASVSTNLVPVQANASTNTAAPLQMPPPKSIFIDDIKQGVDPFFPASSRRVVPVTTNTNATASLVTSAPANFTLKSISGRPGKRFAMINNYVFKEGESSTVSAGGSKAKIRCVEINKDSAVITLDGQNERILLRLR